MSAETTEWLNNNILVGFTDVRGRAWHYKESAQGTEPNHYPLAIPVEDVRRRLFNFVMESGPVFHRINLSPEDTEFAKAMGFSIQFDGDQAYYYKPMDDRQVITTSDTHEVMGLFKDGYVMHQYDEWLTESVETILGESLSIGSAGLLKNRAVAWVQVEVPENIVTPSGVEFRPYLTASTSFDGTLASTFQRNAGLVVCDNTLSAALGEKGQKVKIRHSRYSHLKLSSARDALGIMESIVEDFTADVESLCNTKVTDRQWDEILKALAPVPELDEKGIMVNSALWSKRGATVANTKQHDLRALYNTDSRVLPWRGTGFGVLQTFNTWENHFKVVRGTNRVERNQLNVLNGSASANDAEVIKTLQLVTA